MTTQARHHAPIPFNRAKAKLSVKAVVAFLLSLILCLLVVATVIGNIINYETTLMEQVALEKSIEINSVLSKLLYKTHVLSALVIQNNGEIENFEQIALAVVDDPSILNVLIAPDGVVSDVYPLQGNEAVIGLDFFGEGDGNKEASMAKETGELVIGGPFDLKQGGQGLVGRLPVLMESPNGDDVFWGLVSVTLKFPQILGSVGLEALEKQGMAYKIWRINPDDNAVQIIASSAASFDSSIRFVEKPIHVQNAEWVFCVYPVLEWYQHPECWAMIFVGLCISFLFAFVIQSNEKLRSFQSSLEKLARTDALTGAFNRHSFMEIALMQVEKAIRTESNCFIMMVDLDHFKRINDTYGHQAGDEVLKVCVMRIKEMIRVYDVFARYGGEEFIVFVSDIAESHMRILAERIRQKLSDRPISFMDESIQVTASFGVSLISTAGDLETAINFADTALYKAKAIGRNRVVFYDDVKDEVCV